MSTKTLMTTRRIMTTKEKWQRWQKLMSDTESASNISLCTLRHASLGDYLRRADLKPTAILLGVKQGQVHVVVKMLQIVCKGADTRQELWIYLMANFIDQLGSLDYSLVSEADTILIIRYLHQIFTSETLGRHIAQFHTTDEGYPLLGHSFSFGLNTGQQNDNHLLIQRWLQKAQDVGLTKWDFEISHWVGQILENPPKLLVSLVKTCISEWLACKEDGFELYWRVRFIWQCILSTDLVPSVPERDTIDLMRDTADFLGDHAFTFIAGLSKQQQTMETHMVIAKTFSYASPGCKMATAEYQKATIIAQQQGSNEILKEIYLQQIVADVGIEYLAAGKHTLELIENYLRLDDSNAQVIACLGYVRLQKQNNEGAVQFFQKSLQLNDKNHVIGTVLIGTLFEMKDYEGIMSQIEHYGIPTVGSWLRDSYDISTHRQIMHAARMTNKVDMVKRCYEHEIQDTQLSDEELKEVKHADLVKTTQKTLRYRTRRVAMSSMFRVYLGWLYLEILGERDKAFELWKTAFFQRSEFFNLGNLTSSEFTTDFIPDFFALFSQLIYEKALDADPEVANRMIFHLEHLHRREKDFHELDKAPIRTGLRNVNLLLARLYLKHGRKDDALRMLNDQFQSAIDILEDEIDWNDSFGYGALAALLFLNGQLQNAELALSLKRFSKVGFQAEPEKETDNASAHAQDTPEIDDAKREDRKSEGKQPPSDNHDDSVSTVFDNDDYSAWSGTDGAGTACAGGYTCQYESRGMPYGATAYTCTTCANVNYCKVCFESFRIETGQKKLFLCNPGHDFIKTPPEGLEKIKDERITMNGKSVSFVYWLVEVRKEWKIGFCFKS